VVRCDNPAHDPPRCAVQCAQMCSHTLAEGILQCGTMLSLLKVQHRLKMLDLCFSDRGGGGVPLNSFILWNIEFCIL